MENYNIITYNPEKDFEPKGIDSGVPKILVDKILAIFEEPEIKDLSITGGPVIVDPTTLDLYVSVITKEADGLRVNCRIKIEKNIKK